MPVTGSIQDLIDELKEWLEEADQILDDYPTGPIPGTDRDEVKERLDNVETNIDQILDPNVNPSLDPHDAGSIDTSISPSNRQGYSQTTLQLATEAKSEAHGSNPDHHLIGSRLKTIKHLLTGFREQVGIE